MSSSKRGLSVLPALALVLGACGPAAGGPQPIATISAHSDGAAVAVQAAKPAGKPVFVEFYAVW
jgi:hypothetical protein